MLSISWLYRIAIQGKFLGTRLCPWLLFSQMIDHFLLKNVLIQIGICIVLRNPSNYLTRYMPLTSPLNIGEEDIKQYPQCQEVNSRFKLVSVWLWIDLKLLRIISKFLLKYIPLFVHISEYKWTNLKNQTFIYIIF